MKRARIKYFFDVKGIEFLVRCKKVLLLKINKDVGKRNQIGLSCFCFGGFDRLEAESLLPLAWVSIAWEGLEDAVWCSGCFWLKCQSFRTEIEPE